MRKANLEVKLQVSFLREGERYIAYAPALDLSTSGKSYAQAQKRFDEIAHLFFEELIKKGTLEEVLSDLGWRRVQAQWNPPMVVGQESKSVRVAV